jgi:Uma2 family endonuclease
MTSNRLDAVILANHVPGPRQGEWTYSYYAALPDDGNRYEIIDGALYMAPAPNPWHQEVSGEFFFYLRTYIKSAGLGKVLAAPIDVELSPKNVVQPDMVVILNANLDKIKKTRIVGVPDLVVEIASPSTVKQDRNRKLRAYAGAGIPEYWIVDPEACTIEVLTLEGGTYHLLGNFSGQTPLRSMVVPRIAEVRAEQFFIS